MRRAMTSAAARAAFTKAVELSPTYLPAIVNLARLDIAEKKPADARKRFEALVAKDPKNEQALLALADVMARTGCAARRDRGDSAACDQREPTIGSSATRIDRFPPA